MKVYSSSENPIEGAGFKVGERVQVHPGHDRFMMGDRYGKITSISNVAGSADPVRIRVKLDRSGQSVWFRPDYLMHINPISTRNVLLGVAALGALSVIAYAMSGSSATSTGGSAGSSAATGGSANFGPGIGPGGKIKPG